MARRANPNPYEIAPLTEDDLPHILAIEQEVNEAPWSEASFRHELSHPHGIFLVARGKGEVVGYAGCWVLVDEVHITTVAVSPDHQRQGIGQTLVLELLRQALDRGATCATLEVRAGNIGARALYNGLGFIDAAVRRGYYPNNREDAIVMWLHDLDQGIGA